jgi:hypothetical protein
MDDRKKEGGFPAGMTLKEKLAYTKAEIQRGRETMAEAKRITMEQVNSWKKPVAAKPPVLSLKEKIANTRAMIRRSHEVTEAAHKILEEMAATPIEEECDRIYEDVERKIEALDAEEAEDIERIKDELNEDEQEFADSEELEKSEQPPPISKR